MGSVEDYDKKVSQISQEAEHILFASKAVSHPSVIVKLIGLLEGPFPSRLVGLVPYLEADTPCIGLVTHLERGSLHSLLHSEPKRSLSLFEKVSLATEIIFALTELHSVGLVHADIKPSNILLGREGGKDGWGACFADFGISLIRNPAVPGRGFTTKPMTTKDLQFTLSYVAPELLVRVEGSYLAQSRATDIFSMGTVLWEIFSRQMPFGTLDELEIMGALYRGERPPLDQVMPDTPHEVISLIEACWSKDISSRKPALDCFVELSNCQNKLAGNLYDVFLSYNWDDQQLVKLIYRLLTRSGYRVWIDLADMNHDLRSSMEDGLRNSEVVLIFASSVYQTKLSPMFEARTSQDMKKTIVALLLESKPQDWMNPELTDILKPSSRLFVDFSGIVNLVSSAEPPSKFDDTLSHLHYSLVEKFKELLTYLRMVNCVPALTTSTNSLEMDPQDEINTLKFNIQQNLNKMKSLTTHLQVANHRVSTLEVTNSDLLKRVTDLENELATCQNDLREARHKHDISSLQTFKLKGEEARYALPMPLSLSLPLPLTSNRVSECGERSEGGELKTNQTGVREHTAGDSGGSPSLGYVLPIPPITFLPAPPSPSVLALNLIPGIGKPDIMNQYQLKTDDYGAESDDEPEHICQLKTEAEM